MTAQPDMTGFGRPPAAPSGFRKFTPFLASAATGGALVVLGMYVAQLGLPTRLSPGYVAGTAAGSETLGHLQTSGDEQINYDTRSAGAQATVPLVAGALQGQAMVANTADVACGLGSIAANVAADQRPVWDSRGSPGEFWYGIFHSIAQSSCGVGNAVRGNMVGEMTGAARTTGTISARYSNAAPQAEAEAAPEPVVAHSLADVFAIRRASQHYEWDDVMKARAYIRTLPQDVQDRMFAGLAEGTGWDVLTERTRAYVVLTSIH